VTAGAGRGGDESGRDPGDRRLARGIDRQDVDDVGREESRAEAVGLVARPGEEVRLEEDDEPPLRVRLPGGAERGGDLRGVVGVVVDDEDPAPLPLPLEAAHDAREGREGRDARLERHLELARDRDRREGVLYVVQARQRDLHGAERLSPLDGGEAGAVALEGEVPRRHVGLGRQAERPDPHAGREERPDLLDVRVVETEEGDAEERHRRGELGEGGFQVGEVAIGVEVLEVDVVDHRHDGTQLQERAVELVGLGDEELPLAEAGVRPHRADPSADDDRRIEARRLEDGPRHRGRRRLAVRPGDGDAGLHPHDLGEHLGSLDDRDPGGARGDELGVPLGDGGGVDDDVGAGDLLGPVPRREDRDAQRPEPAGLLAVVEVGAGDRQADAREDLGEAGHADPPDPDEVDAADAEEVHGACCEMLRRTPTAIRSVQRAEPP
jgi:hypothetical protein